MRPFILLFLIAAVACVADIAGPSIRDLKCHYPGDTTALWVTVERPRPGENFQRIADCRWTVVSEQACYLTRVHNLSQATTPCVVGQIYVSPGDR